MTVALDRASSAAARPSSPRPSSPSLPPAGREKREKGRPHVEGASQCRDAPRGTPWGVSEAEKTVPWMTMRPRGGLEIPDPIKVPQMTAHPPGDLRDPNHRRRLLRRPTGYPVGVAPAVRLASLPRLSDPQMVNELRTSLTVASAPTPSVEAILHAVLPFKYVDHTHADAVVTITNTADGEARAREIYGSSVVVIPYIMPGFDLARLCAERFPAEAGPETIGMVLLNHGIFSFGETARGSYERMIHTVSLAEEYLKRQGALELGPLPEMETRDRDNLSLVRLGPAISKSAGLLMLLA